MDIEQQLRTAFAPCDPRPELWSSILARRATLRGSPARKGRTGSRTILFGTIVAVAAAAAMLGLWLNSASPGTDATRAAVPAKVVATLPVDTSPQVQNQAESAAAPEQQPAALPPGSFTVRVPALKVEGNDPAGAALAQRFRDRVIERLGSVPGVVLVNPETVGEYEVRISFDGTASSSTVTVYIDATTSVSFAAHDAALDSISKVNPDDQWRKRLELERKGTLRRASAASELRNPSIALLLGNGFPRHATLSDNLLAGRLPPATPGPDRLELAADDLVRNLRTKVFPISPLLERELLATVGDSGQKFAERRRAFAGLLSIALRRGGFPAVDAAVVRAGAEFALTAVDSSQDFEMLWDALALTRNPELVPYLIRGLDSAPTNMRLYLVKILASVFAEDPRARAALEAASLQNADAVVRMAGVRESQDESRWNDYVVATLNNANLSDLQRLQPIADMVPDNAALTAGNARSKFQLDDKTARELGMLIQRVVQNTDSSRFPEAEIAMATNALKALSTMESPVASDVMVEVLRATDRRVRFLKTPAMTLAFQQFPNDPKVRAALEELASSTDPLDAGFMAKIALQTMDRKASIEKSRQDWPQNPPQ